MLIRLIFDGHDTRLDMLKLVAKKDFTQLEYLQLCKESTELKFRIIMIILKRPVFSRKDENDYTSGRTRQGRLMIQVISGCCCLSAHVIYLERALEHLLSAEKLLSSAGAKSAESEPSPPPRLNYKGAFSHTVCGACNVPLIFTKPPSKYRRPALSATVRVWSVPTQVGDELSST